MRFESQLKPGSFLCPPDLPTVIAAFEGRDLVRGALGLEALATGYTLKSLEERGLLKDDGKPAEQSPIPGLRPRL